jgi:mono/diheme cytochrome c family protein
MDATLARGQERFGIYCAPCHGLDGVGQGMVVKHGLIQPPTYHQDRLRHIPDGQLFATIENGIRNMPAYGPQIPTFDRWAIVSYVRALQISQQGVAPPPTPPPTEKKP